MKSFRPIIIATIAALSLETGSNGSAPKADKSELPKPGVNIADGTGWINIVIEGNHFVVTFFDANKKRVVSPYNHGIVQYVDQSTRSNRIALSLTENGWSLCSLSGVEPPHVFRVLLSLFAPDERGSAAHAFAYPPERSE